MSNMRKTVPKPNNSTIHVKLDDKLLSVLRDTAVVERRTMHNLAKIAIERGLNLIVQEISKRGRPA